MKASKTGLCVYRGLYWANQGLLHAVRALREAEAELEFDHGPASPRLNDNLRRTQAMIEETRALMNRNLAEWIERRDKEWFRGCPFSGEETRPGADLPITQPPRLFPGSPLRRGEYMGHKGQWRSMPRQAQEPVRHLAGGIGNSGSLFITLIRILLTAKVNKQRMCLT